MCGGETGRPSFGGTIAVLFPQENDLNSSISSEASLPSSPNSVVSSASTSSSTSYISSYSLFFRDTDRVRQTTKAIFQTNDANTYNALRGCKYLDMRIEKYGDLSMATSASPPLHHFRLDVAQDEAHQSPNSQAQLEFKLPQWLDLGVSEKGVVGRQVTVREEGGAVLGVGVVGYN
ncbi:hypothetical protein N7510_001252 [Penicillium lagena]|uniref:uncharacterized protein n=1 Tax=Penicillium lagena TaxID=94218 RepID=UPI0025403502|nr:uncharacterized protein N7510_001252 [Penicillium lagena]KAJ5624943.1 hypothetical protein N7510_001252 [Penicillium lagena]